MAEIERRITPKTKGIIVVHLAGLPADVHLIRRLADKHGLWVIKDCAQAHLATLGEQQVGVKVGNRSRIQSHLFICELVEIGEDSVVAHGVMFINDLYRIGGPARGDKTQWCRTRIGNRVSIGSNATILPVQICDDVVIGAGSVVTKNIEVSGIYAGNPAQLLREF